MQANSTKSAKPDDCHHGHRLFIINNHAPAAWLQREQGRQSQLAFGS
jgi:hypothetical protein